jgi:DNA-binding MarR family transcriptional regulator
MALLVTIEAKYVNMADINFGPSASTPPVGSPADARGAPTGPSAPPSDPPPLYELIELLFFAYRDFVSDPDEILSRFDFGRAHHRVLHFVDRNPGMSVADLLDILRITKQSLGRVLRELIDDGYIAQTQGAEDRRQRLLRTTPKGHALALSLAEPQSRRLRAAIAALGPEGTEQARRFLTLVINEENRAEASRLSLKP